MTLDIPQVAQLLCAMFNGYFLTLSVAAGIGMVALPWKVALRELASNAIQLAAIFACIPYIAVAPA